MNRSSWWRFRDVAGLSTALTDRKMRTISCNMWLPTALYSDSLQTRVKPVYRTQTVPSSNKLEYLQRMVLEWPPLWSTGQSSWLLIQRPVFDYRHDQFFWDVVGLERGPLSLVNTTEELLKRSGGSGLENLHNSRRGSAALTTRHLYILQS
jgi:hypothetical protein